MQMYRLILTAITPIHIGTGEVYEPTNFVIDNGYLYGFDEVLFLKSLNKLEQQSFNSKLQDYIQIIDFYKNHKDKAKKIYKHRVEVTKKVEDKYQTTRNRIRKPVSINATNNNAFLNYCPADKYFCRVKKCKKTWIR